MTPDDIATFNDSLVRCLERPDFLGRFYDLFMSSSDEVREKFRHTDIVRQKEVLRQTLYMMYMAVEGEPAALDHLETIAERHSHRDRDIPPGMYDLWLECLLEAAREEDPEFSDEIEKAWRAMMEFGIEFMKARY